MAVDYWKKAKEAGEKYYYGGKPCKYGNVVKRLTSNRACCCDECRAERGKKTQKRYKKVKDDPDWKAKRKEEKRLEYLKNREDPEWQKKQKAYRDANRARKREYDKAYCRENREWKNKKAKEWSKNNPEKRKAIAHNYKAKRRSWESDGMSSLELMEWSKTQDKVCYWCGADCEDSYHIDHYEPLSKGGKHSIENLVIACAPCNLKKNAKDPYEFASEVGRLF